MAGAGSAGWVAGGSRLVPIRRRRLRAVRRPREVTGGCHLSQAPHGGSRSRATGGGGGGSVASLGQSGVKGSAKGLAFPVHL